MEGDWSHPGGVPQQYVTEEQYWALQLEKAQL